ncbi:GNAT family N-acetyltransferase [Foetidibacter luteolus]|uniref:GNAT family N-acetyltransferase n=1 Tax=Foetidibacter luteolus TaxID=2608880 RepID=UPI00129A7327|nr:GNAT family N-acetyltransferase [Foetidibacter luteolus]
MITLQKNNRQLRFRQLYLDDLQRLHTYLSSLSAETKSRFGPHAFDISSLQELYSQPGHTGFIAEETDTGELVAYAIIKSGFLEHDRQRLQGYGLLLNNDTDCTFAPSVADAWQGHGIGKILFDYLLAQLKENGFKRIILWGGVQAGNDRAVAYYNKLGYKSLGSFEYKGLNYDMILEIR